LRRPSSSRQALKSEPRARLGGRLIFALFGPTPWAGERTGGHWGRSNCAPAATMEAAAVLHWARWLIPNGRPVATLSAGQEMKIDSSRLSASLWARLQRVEPTAKPQIAMNLNEPAAGECQQIGSEQIGLRGADQTRSQLLAQLKLGPSFTRFARFYCKQLCNKVCLRPLRAPPAEA